MSTDLEQLLRATLEHRAATVSSGPQWQAPQQEPRTRRVAVLSALAAAAVIVAIALIAALLPAGRHAPVSPGTRLPTGHSAPTPSVRLHGATCAATLPPAWDQTINASRVPAPDGALTPQAMTSDGQLLATRVHSGHDELVVVDTDRTTTTLYTAPAGRIGDVVADSTWSVFEVTGSNGPGTAIVAARPRNTFVTVRAATTRPDAIVQPPVVLDGVVYWTEGDQFGVATVYAYDLAHGTARTLDHGYVSPAVSVGGGVYWVKATTPGGKSGRLVTHVPGTLPPGYTVQPWSAFARLAQDGNLYAWGGYAASAGQPYEFQVWEPGSAAVPLFTPSQDGAGEVPVVVGPYVFARSHVVDVRTGASAPIAADVAFGSAGHLVVQSRAGVSLLSVADLPDLHC